jgi:hypothetical protein
MPHALTTSDLSQTPQTQPKINKPSDLRIQA